MILLLYMSKSVLPMFSSNNFIVSGLKFRSVIIHFELIFVYGVGTSSNFILLHVAVQFSQHHLLKRLSLPHCIFLPPLTKTRLPQVCGFISGLSILSPWSVFLFLCQCYTVLMTCFVVQSEVRHIDFSSSILLSQVCFGYSGSFVFPYQS